MIPPEELHAIHARAVAGRGRAWSVAEFATLLAAPHVFATFQPGAFALVQVIAGEAELLTLAVDPAHQRQGLGRACLTQAEAQAAARGARRMLLEVAADNDAALALYLAGGYLETGRRPRYYDRAGAARCDAIVMARALRSGAGTADP